MKTQKSHLTRRAFLQVGAGRRPRWLVQLAAKQTSQASPEWRSGEARFLPWWIINDETYTTYHDAI